MGNNLYSNLVNFYNVNDESFKEFMSEIYKQILTTHRDVQYVKEHLTEEIEKKLEIYLVDGKFNINIEEKVNEFLENNQEIKNISSQLEQNESLIGDDGTLSNLGRSIFLSEKEMFINVKDYGAKGDGVTDDSEAFKLAFSKGNQIIIPSGKYIVSNIEINEPKVIKGLTSSFAWRTQEQHQTELINISENDMFINAHWDEGGNSLSFENIIFKGNGENKCIRARWDIFLNNCTFENFSIGVYDIHGGIIDKCKFWKNKTGLSQLTDVKVTNCDIAMNEIGIDLSNGNSNHITNNRIEWNTISGIKHKIGVYNTINNNQFDRNNNALDIDSATDMTIVGNRFDRSIEYHIKLSVSGATIVGNKFFKRDITDNNSGTSKPDKAIKLISYRDITFVGNDCNTKIFDDTSIEYSGGYFICEGNYSTNLFTSKTINYTSSGSKWINMSDIQGNFTTVNGWAYDFDVVVEYGNEIINPTFSVSKYNGITVVIPDKGVDSYNVIIRRKSIKQPRVL